MHLICIICPAKQLLGTCSWCCLSKNSPCFNTKSYHACLLHTLPHLSSRKHNTSPVAGLLEDNSAPRCDGFTLDSASTQCWTSA